jgi:transposase
MDNNESERRLRNPVTGRKNYYGSGSLWSGRLAASLFSVFQTCLLHHIDPHKFCLAYLEACAKNGGLPPRALDTFLPWNLTKEQKTAWRYPRPPP